MLEESSESVHDVIAINLVESVVDFAVRGSYDINTRAVLADSFVIVLLRIADIALLAITVVDDIEWRGGVSSDLNVKRGHLDHDENEKITDLISLNRGYI